MAGAVAPALVVGRAWATRFAFEELVKLAQARITVADAVAGQPSTVTAQQPTRSARSFRTALHSKAPVHSIGTAATAESCGWTTLAESCGRGSYLQSRS